VTCPRKGGRVAEGTPLLRVHTPKEYRGFESLPFRHLNFPKLGSGHVRNYIAHFEKHKIFWEIKMANGRGGRITLVRQKGDERLFGLETIGESPKAQRRGEVRGRTESIPPFPPSFEGALLIFNPFI
jgi:hypothetical protein